MGESLAVGFVGGAAGVGLGFAGAAIITAVAPELSATIAPADGPAHVTPAGAVRPTIRHTVAVPMSAVGHRRGDRGGSCARDRRRAARRVVRRLADRQAPAGRRDPRRWR